ncbi:MAG: hypothetical protein RLZZ08_1698 [Pseudomonadota bacterium]|jgi:hypothetical protein
MDDTALSPAPAARRRSSPVKAILGVALAAFALGAAGMWYVAQRDDLGLSGLFRIQSTADKSAPLAAPVAVASPVANAVMAQQGALDLRIAAMEQRLARLDLQAQAAAGNAGRAEGLLIVFAARRAVDRGAPLGYLDDQLSLRFGDAQPNAVRRVIAAGKNPLTLDQLVGRLEHLAPTLAAAPQDEGFFDRLGREMSGLFVVRGDDTPSPSSQNRLARARLYLETGRIDAAIAEVRMLPNAASGADWLTDASRYADTQRALDQLETFAILEPRNLRDGTGERIEQPSPAAPVT